MILSHLYKVFGVVVVFSGLLTFTLFDLSNQGLPVGVEPTPTPVSPRKAKLPVAQEEVPLGRYHEPEESAEGADGLRLPGVVLTASPVPTPIVSFEGLEMEANNSGVIKSPPDTHAAVGLDRLVAVTNGHVAIYDKKGNLLAGGDGNTGAPAVDLNDFCGGNNCFDPKIIYDQYADRFVAVAIDGKNSLESQLWVVVSKDGSPGNLGSHWDRFALPAAATIAAIPGWFDYPGLGLSADAVVVTGNIFSDGSLFLGTKIRVLAKSDLYDGDVSLAYVDFDQNRLAGGFTIQPAHHFGAVPAGTFYLFQRWNSGNLRVWAISDILGSPVLTSALVPTGSLMSCLDSNTAPQSGTSVEIDTVCGRMMNAVWRQGSLWGALTGAPPTLGRAVVHFFEVPTAGYPAGTPTLGQHGLVDGGAGEFSFMPSIAVDGCGNAGMTYTQSSMSRFPEMRYTGHLSTDPPGSTLAPGVVLASPGYYDDFTDLGQVSGDRWGDYSAAVIDPANGTFWIANEYVETTASSPGTARWGTWHANFDLGCGAGGPKATHTPTLTPTSGPSPTASPPPPTATPTPYVRLRLPVVLQGSRLDASGPAASTVILNGDFESGRNSWDQASSQGYELILSRFHPNALDPHSGVWAAWLGGAPDELSSLRQRVTIPPESPRVRYWHWVASEGSCGGDFGRILVDGAVQRQINLCAATETSGWQPAWLNLSAFSGRTVWLEFQAQTDSIDNSNWFLDDIFLVPLP